MCLAQGKQPTLSKYILGVILWHPSRYICVHNRYVYLCKYVFMYVCTYVCMCGHKQKPEALILFKYMPMHISISCVRDFGNLA